MNILINDNDSQVKAWREITLNQFWVNDLENGDFRYYSEVECESIELKNVDEFLESIIIFNVTKGPVIQCFEIGGDRALQLGEVYLLCRKLVILLERVEKEEYTMESVAKRFYSIA